MIEEDKLKMQLVPFSQIKTKRLSKIQRYLMSQIPALMILLYNSIPKILAFVLFFFKCRYTAHLKNTRSVVWSRNTKQFLCFKALYVCFCDNFVCFFRMQNHHNDDKVKRIMWTFYSSSY